jgi:serine/threonine protein phosphatase 1
MKRLIAQIFSTKRQPSTAVFESPRMPDGPLAVVGDIHGRFDLLMELDSLLVDLPEEAPVIFVGDYIDRGEDSRAVLELLSQLGDTHLRKLVCLKGNHEQMCLSFLDDPATNGRAWIRNGGLQTLASYGVSGVGPGSGAKDLRRARDALAMAMGDRLIDWLSGLPLIWQSGNVAVVHAGADPCKPLNAQPSQALLWGHPDFTKRIRDDGQWVIHGHTIVDEPIIENGRIALDTGAYATGRLTAALLDKGGLEFRQTRR